MAPCSGPLSGFAPTGTVEVGDLLFVAAEAREFAGLRRHMKSVERLGGGMSYACRGQLNGRRTILVANGPGPALAGAAVEWAGRKFEVDTAVSTGYCGGLEQSLRVGDIIIALQVYSPESGCEWAAEPPLLAPEARRGAIVSVDRVAGTRQEKAEFSRLGGSAVEMEAAGVARNALRRGWKFCCVRVVSDAADQGFSIDFNAARGADGRFRTERIIALALKRPVARIPELFQLMNNSQRAARALGDFLAECRF